MCLRSKKDDYLIKTYCHLKNKVLAENKLNWKQHPEICNWARIEENVLEGMKVIEEELKRRGLPRPAC